MNPWMKIYFEVNVLFFVSSVLIWIVSKQEIQEVLRTRMAQTLVLLSFLLPVFAYIVPHPFLMQDEVQNFTAASESIVGQLRSKSVVSSSSVDVTSGSNLPVIVTSKSVSLSYQLKFFIIYFAGFLWFLALTLKDYLRLYRIKSNSTCVRRIGSIQIYVSSEFLVPYSYYFFGQRMLMIPSSFLCHSEVLRTASLHELMHHRARDTDWAFYTSLIGPFFWINPAFKKILKQIEDLQELACDEALVFSKKVDKRKYVDTLMHVASLAIGKKVSSFVMTMARPRMLEDRILTLIAKRRPYKKLKVFSVFCFSIVFLTTFCFASEVGLKIADSIGNLGFLRTDPKIQSITEKILNDVLIERHATAGFVIVADPKTGRILSVANTDFKSDRKNHWILSQRMSPMSMAKSLVVARALDRGLVKVDERLKCENGKYRYNGFDYHDWRDIGWESLSVRETIAMSSDICSIKIADKIGSKDLRSMLTEFGFGPGGITSDFPEASSGTFPPEDFESMIRYVPNLVSGSNYTVTPLELLQSYGAIANGGILMKPIQIGDGPVSIRRIVSEETSKQMRTILRSVVQEGTAKDRILDQKVPMAGKTATGYLLPATGLQYPVIDKLHSNVAAFIGFAPVEEPKILVFVGIVNAQVEKGTASGGLVAAPLFGRIVNALVDQF